MHNVLSCVPYKEKKRLAEYLKQIFNSPTDKMANDIAHMIAQNEDPLLCEIKEGVKAQEELVVI
jgi:hypothetical protein